MKILVIVAVSLLFVPSQGVANILTISAAQGGQVPAGVNYVNFDDLALGSATQTATGPTGSVLVGFEGGAAVQGDVWDIHRAPAVYNNQGAFFGGQPDGLDATPYLMTFSGSIKIDFANPQKYVGLLWGTPDYGQALQLYSDALGLVGSFSGTDLFDWGLVSITDDNRSAYVNINSAVPFDFVVATPSAFEFDNLAYFTETVALPGESRTLSFPNGSAVPDGGSSAVLVGLAALGCIGGWKKMLARRA